MASTEIKRSPVKHGCLACRASHTRCGGEKPTCSTCLTKERACVYTKSNRGGPRVSNKKRQQNRSQSERSESHSASSRNGDEGPVEPKKASYGGLFDDLIMPMIAPGAGLKTINPYHIPHRTGPRTLNTDHIFESIFGQNITLENVPHEPLLRSYGSDKDILNAYYIFIHAYFPILPPSEVPIEIDCPMSTRSDDFEPCSPISLAICAILALIPHPDDTQPQSHASLQHRRKHAELFSQLTMESVEIESEMLASFNSPADALNGDQSSFRRALFHPTIPIEIEGILAFLVLSIYEYAQRGNLVKMRNRSSQALDAATRLSLHEEDLMSYPDQFTEARRRAWWMTYVCILQASIVSSTSPIIPIDRSQFSTPLPSNASDSGAWSSFLDAQQIILKCTQYTVLLKKAQQMGTGFNSSQDTMSRLNKELDSLEANHYWDLNVNPNLEFDFEECVLAQSLRCQAKIKMNSARIKLHRYEAFLDVPVFTKRHCDLQGTSGNGMQPSISCCGGAFVTGQPFSPSIFDVLDNWTFPTSPGSDISLAIPNKDLIFSNISSAKICMAAGLEISRAFEALPYPNSTLTGSTSRPLRFSQWQAPRTMPAFSCCAMQGSYALLMLCHKSRELERKPDDNSAAGGLGELYAGLERVLRALENYSSAFEAIDGMRVQIQEAFNLVKDTRQDSFS